MKKITILSLVLGASAACMAAEEVAASNAFGAFGVTDARTYKLISVPWVATSETADQAVDIATLVNPDQLAEDDILYVASDKTATSYNVFAISNNQWVGKGTTTIGSGGQPEEASGAAPSTTTVARGNALWLKTASVNTFYLVGQKPSSSDKISVTITANKQNLIAASSAAAIKISDITGLADRAKITIPANGGTGTAYQYKSTDSTWYKWDADKKSWSAVTDSDVIPAGKGAWYYSTTGGNIEL